MHAQSSGNPFTQTFHKENSQQRGAFMTQGMASNIITDSVAAQVAPVAPVKKGEASMLNLRLLLPRLSLMTLERGGVLYMKATWFV
jgi:hypothetical protein